MTCSPVSFEAASDLSQLQVSFYEARHIRELLDPRPAEICVWHRIDKAQRPDGPP